MQGGTPESAHEMMLPYAGIIRIRFMGMISARITPDTPANILRIQDSRSGRGRRHGRPKVGDDVMAGRTGHLYFSTSLTSYSFGQFFPVRYIFFV